MFAVDGGESTTPTRNCNDIRKIDILDCNAEHSTFYIILYVKGNIYNQGFPIHTFIDEKIMRNL